MPESSSYVPGVPVLKKKTIVTLFKPTRFAIDECNTAGELVAALNRHDPSFLSSNATCLVEGAGIALNGKQFDPAINLGNLETGLLNIRAQPGNDILVSVTEGYQDGAISTDTYDAQLSDTGLALKRKITMKKGTPVTLQTLRFEGKEIEDDTRLANYGMHGSCTVRLDRLVVTMFTFHIGGAVPMRMLRPIDEPLGGVLMRAAEFLREDIKHLHFQFGVMYPRRPNILDSWLDDPCAIFTIESVVGSLEENGLVNEVNIQVFLTNRKRKRAEEKSEDTETNASRPILKLKLNMAATTTAATNQPVETNPAHLSPSPATGPRSSSTGSDRKPAKAKPQQKPAVRRKVLVWN